MTCVQRGRTRRFRHQRHSVKAFRVYRDLWSLMDESKTTGSVPEGPESEILDALVAAVLSVAPTLRCLRRKRWALFSDEAELLVIMAQADGVRLYFAEDVVCSVGDRPEWSSGTVIDKVNEETLSMLRGLVRKLQLASLERPADFTRKSRHRNALDRKRAN